MKQKIPRGLQPLLQSCRVDKIDLKIDRVYIVHQILSRGRWEDWQWLWKAYPLRELKEIFVHHPYKDYTPSRFNFVKNYLFSLKNHILDERLYAKNLPRRLG